MRSLTPYLIFHGQCDEAMRFYCEVFGGSMIEQMTFGDSPIPVPDEHANRIFNSEIRIGDIVIKASDDLPGHDVIPGSNVSLFVTLEDSAEQRRVFDLLSDGGKVLFPIEGHFGMLEDKYAIRWMLVQGE